VMSLQTTEQNEQEKQPDTREEMTQELEGS
jgi:hypothetical protein